MYNKIINVIKDKKIAILGFGKEGKSTYNFIRKYLKDKEIDILDKNNEIIIEDNNVNLILGDNYLKDLEKYDLIIKTPGISLNNIDTSKIKNKITSECNLLLENIECKKIGITGTKGKSTTSSLIYKIIKDQYEDTYLCGNIGIPIFDYLDKITKDTILVIEMSAYHTEYIKKSPDISIILNLYEEHLDYFKTKEKYFLSKLNMFKYLNNDSIGIYSEDNEILKELVEKEIKNKNLIKVLSTDDGDKIDNNMIFCDEQKIYMKELNKIKELYNLSNERNLLGRHNIENIMFALAISEKLNLNLNKTIKSINEFQPLEHRMELVGKYNNIIFYNDSIATIPEATINCIETLKKVNTLIFGGMDRKINYDNFVEYLKNSKIENLICLKDTGYTIGKKLENYKSIFYAENMKEAVEYAYKYTKKDNICLLSPAASSYNFYKNFEEKGKEYKNIIKYFANKVWKYFFFICFFDKIKDENRRRLLWMKV